MKKDFDYFVKKIPINIHNNTKSIMTDHIAVFIPEEFVIGKKLHVEEYHFVICFTTPPKATIRSEEHRLKKGSLICMALGDDILVHPIKNASPVKFMTICVNKEFMQNIYIKAGGKGNLSFRKLDSTYSCQLLEGIEALAYEVLNYGRTNQLMIESMENRIALQLLRDSSSEYAIYSSNPQNSSQYIVQKAIKYIETYYSSNITNKDICDAIYISPPYMQKIFLKHTGRTPYQYIMECRHRKAKEMLETSDAPIEKIARQCGYVNSSHFSTAFKQREGISLSTYKRTYKYNRKEMEE